MNIAMLAGTISTILFMVSYMPMLIKAARTKELSSYSLGNLAVCNLGNVVHSIYVFSLPVGPIWFLHSFYLVSSALMLLWFIRYRHNSHPVSANSLVPNRLQHDETFEVAKSPW